MRERIVTAVKGFCVGGTMLVPGVSGGSMAMILGAYDKLVSSVSSFRKHKRESFFFLLLFAFGGGLGALLLAKPLLSLIERWPLPTLYFFLGAVAGGIPLIVRKAEVRKFSWTQPLYAAAGIVAVLLLSLIPAGTFSGEMDAGIGSVLLLGAAGFIAAVALVLPGISVSYLLLLLGLYDETMRAIGELYLPFLIPLGVGLLAGVVLTTRVLELAMTRHPQPTYLIILGFVLGSVAELFPGFPTGWNIPVCILTLFLGFFAIHFLSRQEEKLEAAAG